MVITIGRPINGIPLNGDEFLLDDEGNEKEFPSIEKAEDFLIDNGVTAEDLKYFNFYTDGKL